MMRLTFVTVLFIFATFSSFSQQLVLPGDFPDPSVVKIGDSYWASATTSNWLPAFPLLKSKDLIRWTSAGSIFTKAPEWADYYFWAPEITYDKGKVYVYYAAHKKNGNLCLAVATADQPEGPYTDLGPVMCEAAGSIDGFPMRDKNGKLYLVWKEDGNSVKKPTPIWAMEMKEDRTGLIGEKKELFRNDQSWEANLVEGVSMIKHGEYIYAFYAGAGCCGAGCAYTTGIARAKDLLGPWEKYQKNPVMVNDQHWKCPGHGTPIEKEGRFYFLYHAYAQEGGVYTGREGLLQEFKFTTDGWITFMKETAPAENFESSIVERFKSNKLSDKWQWSVFQDPSYRIKRHLLELNALPNVSGAFLAQKTLGLNYTAEVIVLHNKSDAAVGLAAIGDDKNLITVLATDDSIKLMRVRDGKQEMITAKPLTTGKLLQLKMEVKNGKDIKFFYSNRDKNYVALNETAIDGGYLPPWDRALRVGLIAQGSIGEKAIFKEFTLITPAGKSPVAIK